MVTLWCAAAQLGTKTLKFERLNLVNRFPSLAPETIEKLETSLCGIIACRQLFRIHCFAWLRWKCVCGSFVVVYNIDAGTTDATGFRAEIQRHERQPSDGDSQSGTVVDGAARRQQLLRLDRKE